MPPVGKAVIGIFFPAADHAITGNAVIEFPGEHPFVPESRHIVQRSRAVPACVGKSA